MPNIEVARNLTSKEYLPIAKLQLPATSISYLPSKEDDRISIG
jgi:hypothetical protein